MYQYSSPYGFNMGLGGQSQQIVRVNGENGARAYQMMPNSSALLLDENDPIVWLAMTDGAGYKTVSPYHIEPYVPKSAPDWNELSKRIERLEEVINESNNAKIRTTNEQCAGNAVGN